jgi:hypothetical protein
LKSVLQEFIEGSIKIIKSKAQVNSNGQMGSITSEIGGKVRDMAVVFGRTNTVTVIMENGLREEHRALVSTYHKVFSNVFRLRISR